MEQLLKGIGDEATQNTIEAARRYHEKNIEFDKYV